MSSVDVLFVQGNELAFKSPICTDADPLEFSSPIGTPQILPTLAITHSNSPITESPLLVGIPDNSWTENLSTTTPLPREVSVLPDVQTPPTGSPFWVTSEDENTHTPTHTYPLDFVEANYSGPSTSNPRHGPTTYFNRKLSVRKLVSTDVRKGSASSRTKSQRVANSQKQKLIATQISGIMQLDGSNPDSS